MRTLTKENKMSKRKERRRSMHVLITTEYRGVFMGELDERDNDSVTLTHARNCVYWSRKIRGVFGLAATGPDSECRIGPAVPRLTLRKVTSITECTDAAVAAWEAEPWK